ncbi:MAG: amino acid permease [Deltaproteobacteria bacterium]|nr:amino acid permease [Deltaproteobacteria bacterium]
MSNKKNKKNGFGTAPVYLAAISTILGAILFLRFGYAVGHVGLLGAVLIILIGHAITVPTGLAVAEIATNLRVRGGGEYFIISRSFGSTLGGAIGISLYLSQAISVAFYLIAFAEAFRPLFPIIESYTGFVPDVRIISLPVALTLAVLIAKRGASIGIVALWGVVLVLVTSLTLFFAGKGMAPESHQLSLFSTVTNPDSFFHVFAIVFPAFTGMTAGVGLSGDLRNPRRSIPLGTLAATITGLVVYVAVVIKLNLSATPADLASDQFIMSRIALWGPIIFIGLGAATLSSALGSILVAPRTLQALCADHIFPSAHWNNIMSRGRGKSNEPANATWFTSVIVVTFVALGNVDFVAQIISMFFMITYGALCSISFLEHFAGNPSYRPTFRTKWYASLIGAISCILMMFMMQPGYAIFAIAIMGIIYTWLGRTRQGERNLAMVFRGVLFQLTRKLQIAIQKRQAAPDMTNWRPSFIAIARYSTAHLAPFNVLRWISHHYGFSSYIHFIEGPLTVATQKESQHILKRLISQTQVSGAGIYVDTIISPTFRTAIAQIVQTPGIAGMENNSILFSYQKENAENLTEIIDGSFFAAIAGLNICILRSGPRHFGFRKSIHIWLTPGDYRNANLMILLAYILLGHSEWGDSEIRVFDVIKATDEQQRSRQIDELIFTGRLPVAADNVHKLTLSDDMSFEQLVSGVSENADLVMLGLSLKKMRKDGGKFLQGFACPQDILFVRAGQDILISGENAGDELTDAM